MSRDMAQYEAEMSGTDTDNDSDFEIEDPEAHQPKYTPFSFLFLDMENMKKMEPFLDITIEEQEEFFRSLAKRKKHHHTHKHKHKHKQKHKRKHTHNHTIK
jgi:ABC-type nickel/cobalt efflux system permease component RcnA